MVVNIALLSQRGPMSTASFVVMCIVTIILIIAAIWCLTQIKIDWILTFGGIIVVLAGLIIISRAYLFIRQYLNDRTSIQQ